MACQGSTLVEHLPHHPKAERSSPVTAVAPWDRKVAKQFDYLKKLYFTIDCKYSTVIQHLPHHPKFEVQMQSLLLPQEQEKCKKWIIKKLYLTIAYGSSTVVERSANHPKVKGSSPGFAATIIEQNNQNNF